MPRLHVELRDLPSGAGGLGAADQSEPRHLASDGDEECVPARLSEVGVEVAVLLRLGGAYRALSMTRQLGEVFVEQGDENTTVLRPDGEQFEAMLTIGHGEYGSKLCLAIQIVRSGYGWWERVNRGDHADG